MPGVGLVKDVLTGRSASYVARLEDEPDYRTVSVEDYEELDDLIGDVEELLEDGSVVRIESDGVYGGQHEDEVTARDAAKEIRKKYNVGLIESILSSFKGYKESLRAGHQVKLVSSDPTGVELRKIEETG